MGKIPKPTRAQRRAQRPPAPTAGVYGVDAEDMWADFLRARFLCFAASPSEARARIRDAGFHRRQISVRWDPNAGPPEGVPEGLGDGDRHWYRTRWNQSGWTPWERLPEDFRQADAW